MKLKANNEIRLTPHKLDKTTGEWSGGVTIKAGEVFDAEGETASDLIACGAAYEPTVTEAKVDSAAEKAAEKAEANAKK